MSDEQKRKKYEDTLGSHACSFIGMFSLFGGFVAAATDDWPALIYFLVLIVLCWLDKFIWKIEQPDK